MSPDQDQGERIETHYLPVVWLAVGMVAQLGLTAAALSRLTPDISVNYTDAQGPVFSGSFRPETPPADGLITAVTFNLRYGTRVQEAIREFRRHSRLRTADVILLQEMDEQSTAAMAEALGYDYVYYPACVHPRLKRHMGNAVLSRAGLRDTGKTILPHLSPHNEQLRIATHATTVAEDLPLTVYSVHLETPLLHYNRRLEQLAAVLATAPPDSPVIVGGDFNTPPGEELARMEELFRRFGMRRVSTGAGDTWSLGPLDGVLDHIFVRGLNLVRAGTVEDSRCSDHKPLWVELVAGP